MFKFKVHPLAKIAAKYMAIAGGGTVASQIAGKAVVDQMVKRGATELASKALGASVGFAGSAVSVVIGMSVAANDFDRYFANDVLPAITDVEESIDRAEDVLDRIDAIKDEVVEVEPA